MSLLEQLKNKEYWYSFLNYKLEKGTLFFNEEKDLRVFIDNECYLEKVEKLINGNYCLSIPTKKLINKMGSTKKRVVYTFPEDENYILKMIAYLLHVYDDVFPSNVYSFRKNYSVKNALKHLVWQRDVYCYKVDIHNYFNSIDTKILLDKLESIIDDDLLMWFFRNITTQNKCIFEGKEIFENMGGMAGIPISAFFANVYLMDMDKYFWDNKITYARYSDDIVVFSRDKDKLDEYISILHGYIYKNKLQINRKKEHIYLPNCPWEFLGVSCHNGVVDLSPVTLEKIKGKIRRKSRALYRWKIKKGMTTENAIRGTIKIFSKKFYDVSETRELTWSKWFFPMLTTDKSLRIIDQHLEENLRYIATGRHTKLNYKQVPYSMLKKLGFVPLVNSYWEYKKSLLENAVE